MHPPSPVPLPAAAAAAAQFIQTVLPKMGISATVIDPADLGALERALEEHDVRRDRSSAVLLRRRGGTAAAVAHALLAASLLLRALLQVHVWRLLLRVCIVAAARCLARACLIALVPTVPPPCSPAAAPCQVSLFFSESPTNPYLRCVDVPRIKQLCAAKDAVVVIDSTFATPINQQVRALMRHTAGRGWGCDVLLLVATSAYKLGSCWNGLNLAAVQKRTCTAAGKRMLWLGLLWSL